MSLLGEGGRMNFPNKKYQIIYADPPWSYSSFSSNSYNAWGLAKNHYQTMNVDDIKKIPIHEITDKNCMLFLWVTLPNLKQGIEVLEAWGFEYKTTAFVWIKQDKSTIKPKKYGMGWYTRSNAELVLLGRKGKFERKSTRIQQVVNSTIGEHSQKPNEVRDRILKLCGDLPRIELFARTKVHGWDVWGNDEKLENTPLESWF